MNVIWKRPDGYHGATPADFTIVKVSGHSNLWVHKQDKDTFPFRVSGGWEEEAQSKKLNNLVNLLGDNETAWVEYLEKAFDHSMKDNAHEFCADLYRWLDELKRVLKGGNWEVEIMGKAIDSVVDRLHTIEPLFLARCP